MFIIVPSRSRDSFVIYATAVFLPIRSVNACMCTKTYHKTDAFVSVTSKKVNKTYYMSAGEVIKDICRNPSSQHLGLGPGLLCVAAQSLKSKQ